MFRINRDRDTAFDNRMKRSTGTADVTSAFELFKLGFKQLIEMRDFSPRLRPEGQP